MLGRADDAADAQRDARRRQEAARRPRPIRPRASSGAGKNTGRACSCRRRCSRKWASTTPARSTATTCRCAAADAEDAARDCKGPQLLHVITTKGKGYELAEGRPDRIPRRRPVRSERGPGQERPARQDRPTPRSSATGCATWPRPTRGSGHHAGDARRLRPGALLEGISPSATSTSPSPSSTR